MMRAPESGREDIVMLRRNVLLASAGAVLGLPLSRISLADSGQRRFTLRVPEAYKATVERALDYEGDVSQETDAKGLPLVWVFAGLVLLPKLAQALMELRRDIVHGGVVIDLRGEVVSIETDKQLPSRVVLVIDPDGKTHLYERGQLGSEADMVKALSGLAK
jgi:hypothetical protein